MTTARPTERRADALARPRREAGAGPGVTLLTRVVPCDGPLPASMDAGRSAAGSAPPAPEGRTAPERGGTFVWDGDDLYRLEWADRVESRVHPWQTRYRNPRLTGRHGEILAAHHGWAYVLTPRRDPASGRHELAAGAGTVHDALAPDALAALARLAEARRAGREAASLAL